MGHISPAVAKQLVSQGFVTGVSLDTSPDEPIFCESCVYAKSRRQAVPKAREGERATSFGEEIHSDVWGPSSVETLGGRRYFVSFTDDYSRLTHIYLLQRKLDTFEAYKAFEAWANTQLDTKIKCLHSDRGGDYLSKAFIKHLTQQGTVQKLTVHDTPEENGVAENLNRVGLERTRAILHASGLPKFLWGEALRHVIWLKNRTSTVAVPLKTPIEAVTGQKPDLLKLPEWGCQVWVHTKKNLKLDARAIEGRWVGFDEQSKGSRIYWPQKRSITVERSVVFAEPLAIVDELEGEDGEPSSKSSSPPNEPAVGHSPSTPLQSATIPVPDTPRPQRIRKPSQYVQDLRGSGSATGLPNRNAMPVGLQVPVEPIHENADVEEELTLLVDAGDIEPLEPKSLAEARRQPNWPDWERAIQEELKTLEDTGTWEIS
jgi:hypothetical protein